MCLLEQFSPPLTVFNQCLSFCDGLSCLSPKFDYVENNGFDLLLLHFCFLLSACNFQSLCPFIFETFLNNISYEKIPKFRAALSRVLSSFQ